MRCRRLWAWPSELRRSGVLGINARNLGFVSGLNPRKLYPRVDDKSVTKRICDAERIPVPQTYAVLERYGDIRRFGKIIGNRQQFVIKPACGAGGRGVLAIAQHDGQNFHVSSGQVIPLAELRHHLSTTLSGLYSLGGRTDKVIVEEQIAGHPAFENLAFGGTPDIRIIVLRGTPIMAMLRLPTKESKGRANLHQGAIGLGLDLETGRTFGGVWHNHAITRHPESDLPVRGIAVPFWTDVLTIAAKLCRVLELGYVGVDIVLDAKRGPVVLEANARPGLAIQVANRSGLLSEIWALTVRAARIPALVGVVADGHDSTSPAPANPRDPDPATIERGRRRRCANRRRLTGSWEG
ncbi:MAG: alpha-L-glutamate ligase-like protein [Phycisphaerae bacterium]|nr:alpha-L-glutamate ligase-like protein [Phycisphaerae bacterium]